MADDILKSLAKCDFRLRTANHIGLSERNTISVYITRAMEEITNLRNIAAQLEKQIESQRQTEDPRPETKVGQMHGLWDAL